MTHRLVIRRLERAAIDRNWSVRLKAVQALGRLDTPSAVAPILSAVSASSSAGHDERRAWENNQVYKAATEAIGALTNPGSILPLLKGRVCRDSNLQSFCRHALKTVPAEWKAPDVWMDAIPLLIAALADDDVSIRHAAVDALSDLDPDWLAGEIGQRALPYVAALRRRMRPNAWSTKNWAHEVETDLTRMDPSWATHPVVQQLLDRLHPLTTSRLVAEVRTGSSTAVAALTRHPTRRAVRLLVKILNDHGQSEDARAAAADALAGLGSLSVPALAGLLRASSSGAQAAEILGRIRHPSALPALVDAFEAGDQALKLASADAIGRIGDPATASILVRAWQSDLAESPVIAAALARLGWTPDSEAACARFELQLQAYGNRLLDGGSVKRLRVLLSRGKALAEAALSARQDSCEHVAGQWNTDGGLSCVKCGKFLRQCPHEKWVLVHQFREEGQYRCAVCGKGSY